MFRSSLSYRIPRPGVGGEVSETLLWSHGYRPLRTGWRDGTRILLVHRIGATDTVADTVVVDQRPGDTPQTPGEKVRLR